MRARRLMVATAAIVFGWASAASAASPGSGSVGPSDQSLSWNGKVFTVGSTPSPDVCPESMDPNDVLCDHFDLTVSVSSGYWDSNSGGVTLSISWGSSGNNFDLYVYTSSGSLVASSAKGGTKSESVYLSQPDGTYEVRVVPVLVTLAGASGSATFSSEPDPTPTPSLSPPVGGGGGGGGGGGNGGGSNGSGGFTYSPTTGGYYPPGFYYGNSGGGTTSFGPHSQTVTSRQVYYGQATPYNPKPISTTRALPVVTFADKRIPQSAWLLLPLGLLLLAAVAYVVFEPGLEVVPSSGQADRPAEEAGPQVPPPVIIASVGGMLIRGAVAAGSVLRSGGAATLHAIRGRRGRDHRRDRPDGEDA